MILSFTLIFVALAILLLLLYIEGGQNHSVDRLEDLAGRTRPVDLEAFRNLLDPREEDFLRASLLPREFRVIQRERMRAAVDYVRNYFPQRSLPAEVGRGSGPQCRSARRAGGPGVD